MQELLDDQARGNPRKRRLGVFGGLYHRLDAVLRKGRPDPPELWRDSASSTTIHRIEIPNRTRPPEVNWLFYAWDGQRPFGLLWAPDVADPVGLEHAKLNEAIGRFQSFAQP